LSINLEGHGYTKEEAVEITTHGSLAVITEIMNLLSNNGMRQAKGGEFTLRAFLNGAMDLTQAEAVHELVTSQSQMERGLALGRLEGTLHNRIEELKQNLLGAMAIIEVQLDYAEDEVEDFDFPLSVISDTRDSIASLSDTYETGRLYSQGVKIVLAGSTNAGKSSLFNLLLKQKRAIVSDIQGTTRDYIEAQTVIRGVPVRLFDTAGLRDSSDLIENEGIKRTKELIDICDVVIYLVDGVDENTIIDRSIIDNSKTILAYTKRDIKHRKEAISISTITGEGLDHLFDAILEKTASGISISDDSTLVIESSRQHKLLEEAREALNTALELNSIDMGLDIIAQELNNAITALGGLTGEITSDDVLDKVFGGFCVGK
ncbi:MAG: tRNA uridine-5-carboxymethylaminomethyl(34) synthesis GTPase MnmE, partial [Sphaerochaetaceae bacterium]|nr:tRNA uridine-5-carboxymethylaminomethyl(34) synthesis GTPase MnmE [Sphaerochaetaceae bacterium]